MSTLSGPRPTLLRPLRPRDPGESHRVATPLELLTDLCFVVAVAEGAAVLHHAISADHVAVGVGHFAMIFFAIWWAWLNFTWFSSAYDNDDVAYRLLTILQILGSLVLAAGVASIAEDDFTLAVVGYLIMRVALVAQWLRAARADPAHQITCRRYAVGILVVQLFWVLLLLVPTALKIPTFALGVVLELAVPAFAERAGLTPWHPHHVAERYGLFFIIVLGETILSTTVALEQARGEVAEVAHATAGLIMVVVGGVLTVFSLWWLYFSRSGGPLLEQGRDRLRVSFGWGFGHYFVLAAGAAIGAGLAARVDFWTHQEHPSALGSAALVTGPVAVLLVALWLVHLRRHDPSPRTAVPFLGAVLLLIGTTFTPVPELLTGVICALLVVVEVRLAGLVAASD